MVAVKLVILPEPLAARPMEAALLVQLYTVPGGAETASVKVTAVVAAPLHNTWLDTAFTVGVGLTSIVAVIGVPAQPLAVGVMVKVTVMGEVVVLVSVPLILPAPLAAILVTVPVLFLVQLYTTPDTVLPVMAMVVIGVAEHTVCEAGVATAVGVGLMVIVNDIGVPLQVVPPFI